MIIVYIMVGVQSALGLYMGNYFWALSSEDFRWVVLAGPLGLILGTPFTHRMNQRFDKMPSVVFGTAWYTLFALSPPILRLLGWFPDNGHPFLLPLLVGAALIGGVGVVQALITAGSMMADIADEHELATRRRQEDLLGPELFGEGRLWHWQPSGWLRPRRHRLSRQGHPWRGTLEVLTRLGWLYGPLVAGFDCGVVLQPLQPHQGAPQRRARTLEARRQERSLRLTLYPVILLAGEA